MVGEPDGPITARDRLGRDPVLITYHDFPASSE